MRPRLCIVLLLASAFALSDSPFPDNKKNHWVYTSMIQIKKDRLWYRVNDKLPKRKPLTRIDMATKTFYLAFDSQTLINKFAQTTELVSRPAKDKATKNWQARFVKSFPKKKILYQNYLRRVTKLWNYFLPDIKPIAKKLKVDPALISQNLRLEKVTLDGVRISKRR